MRRRFVIARLAIATLPHAVVLGASVRRGVLHVMTKMGEINACK